MCTITIDNVLALLNTVDPLVSKLQTLAEVAVFVDDAAESRKGPLAVSLIGVMSDYIDQIAAILDNFTRDLPRQQGCCPEDITG